MKLKRLVSAVLAVGMALTILPTAAFANDTSRNITGLVLDESGYIDIEKSTPPPDFGQQNPDWEIEKGSNQLVLRAILSNASFREPAVIECPVVSHTGTIKEGTFRGNVQSFGKIESGDFYNLTSYARYGNNWGSTSNAVIKNYTISAGNSEYTTSLSNSIVWNSVAIDYTKTTSPVSINNSILSNIPDGFTTHNTPSTYQSLIAEGCTIEPIDIDTNVLSTPLPVEAVFQGAAYLIGTAPTKKFKVTANSPLFKGWDLSGKGDAEIQENGRTLIVTLNNDNVTIKACGDRVPLSEVVMDTKTGKYVPGYNNEAYAGSDYDGWSYDKISNTLTVYDNGVVDIGNAEVDWNIVNKGEIKSGIFNAEDEVSSTLNNGEEDGAEGKISGGTFNVKVNNYGTIDGGTFNLSVSNAKTVNGGTFVGRYGNRTKTDKQNGVGVVTVLGETKGGVFSHYADFYGQDDLQKTTLTLNKCTANGISDLVYVVGPQTLTIEADTTCTGWEFSTDADYEETVAKQVPTDSKETFTLTLNGDDERNVTLTALLKEGYYRMNLVDGVATVNDKEVTSAKAGDTVKLTADAAPEGMVFDRWEITPTDAALNLEGFDANAATTSFKMPAQTLTIRAMYRMADVEEPNVLGTVAVVATAGVGAAVLGWTGYNIAADLYAQSILPEGTAIPETKEALAVMLWQNAGKPEVVAADGTALSETEQAQQWVVANGLMENEEDGTFHPEKGVGKFAALNAVKAQQETANVQ